MYVCVSNIEQLLLFFVSPFFIDNVLVFVSQQCIKYNSNDVQTYLLQHKYAHIHIQIFSNPLSLCLFLSLYINM